MITIDVLTNKTLSLKFHYNADLVEMVKEIPGRKFNPDEKFWTIPLASLKPATEILDRYYELSEKVISLLETENLEKQKESENINKLISTIDLDSPLSDGKILFKHQKEGVLDLIKLKRVILAHDMGLGKTLEALVAAKILKDENVVEKIIVVCPVSLKANWKREAEPLGLELEIYSWAKIPTDINCKFVFIADECFPYETLIHTEIGRLPIGYIIENNLNVKIWSSDVSHKLALKPINRYIAKTNYSSLLRIKLSNGEELICTGNHKIWTEENGYIEARNLVKGAHLCVLQKDFYNREEKKTKNNLLQPTLCIKRKLFEKRHECYHEATNLQNVRKNFYGQTKRQKKFENKFLLDVMQQSVEVNKAEELRVVQTISPYWSRVASGSTTTNPIRKNENEQPHVDVWSERKNDEIDEGKDVSFTRREWKTYKTTNNNCRDAGVTNRTRNPHEKSFSFIRVITSRIQSRFSLSKEENSDRDRRENSQNKEVEILRREENESLGIVGVESVEILELGYRRKSAFNSGRDKKVYNLEIADNHNYFANNVLVSNCHMAQGGTKTQRGKNFIALSKDDNCMAVYLLTGTPMKNGRPINLFPLLKAIKHPIVQDQSFYHRRYCDAKATRFSQWDTSGAKNLDELFLKTKDLILRKTKKECLDLPDKLRVIREIEPSKKALEDYNNKLAELKKRFEERIASGEVSGESQALVALGMIRQSSSLAKIETAIELCEELLEQNNQIVVFTEFLETAKRIKNYFLDDAVLLTGETKEDDRQLAVDLFQTNRARIFVGTIKAGGVGITLTASSTVILIDRPYTPGDAEQAEDRLHRIGQKNPVTSIWIQYGETDKWIDDLLQSKMENINLVLSGVKKKMKFNSINEIAKHALRKTLLNQSE